MIMLLQGVKLIGTSHKTSKKGTNYYVCLIAQGVDTMQLLLPSGFNVDSLEPFKTYDITLKVTTYNGRTDFKILDILGELDD